ncbi:hypothetical protein E1176_19810 [Fulvivirga sp. RKSG066]|uniref:YqaA family protein n=1 Tax=Fulvivirga aurantia TaxID=2529383 RepID=UPI0012BC329F|nr:hypothetical protein [Fulvivirga aurantia]MTI23285.1 hypothetical protein [Fulvivirga aurantia]
MKGRTRFLIKNLLKGLLGLAVIIIIYTLLQKYAGFDVFMDYISQWPLIVYTVFIISEVVFGIIPPELFMIWSIKSGAFEAYALDVALLAIISFMAGVLGFFIGSYLKKALPTFFEKYVLKYKKTLKRYGGLLIFVGAVTPIPFSAVCMLVGSTHYPFGRFAIIASARFLRFAVYAFTIYQFN